MKNLVLGGLVAGCKSCFEDCLQQSKMPIQVFGSKIEDCFIQMGVSQAAQFEPITIPCTKLEIKGGEIYWKNCRIM